MKKIITLVLAIMLFSSTVSAGENLEGSKKFWSNIHTGTSGANVGTAVIVVGVLAAAGISHSIAAAMDAFSDQNETIHTYTSDLNISDANVTVETFIADEKTSVEMTTYAPDKVKFLLITTTESWFGDKMIHYTYTSTYSDIMLKCTRKYGDAKCEY